MDNHTATELAYKNGYEQGKMDAVRHGRWVERLDGDCEFVHHMCSECKADAFFQYIIEADWDENIDGEW